MKNKIIGKIVFVIFIAILVLGVYLSAKKDNFEFPKDSFSLMTNKPSQYVEINGDKTYVLIASTALEKAQGLSGRKSLANDTGMLFIFEVETYPSFWMKDMEIPLDIIWVNNGEIVDIHEKIDPPKPRTPDSALSLYTPKKPITHVLEVNSGFVERNRIKVGDKVNLTHLE